VFALLTVYTIVVICFCSSPPHFTIYVAVLLRLLTVAHIFVISFAFSKRRDVIRQMRHEAHWLVIVIVMMSMIFILNCRSSFISFRKLACLPKMTLYYKCIQQFGFVRSCVSSYAVLLLSVDALGTETGHYHSVISMLLHCLQIGYFEVILGYCRTRQLDACFPSLFCSRC